MATAAGIAGGASLAWAGGAQAANLTVGTTNDTSSVSDCATDNTDCSLRQAIGLANADTTLDVISFHSGLTGTITLGSDLPTITEQVTIQGPGASSITVDAATHRIFDVKPSTPGDPVSISGLTLTGGGAVASTTNPNRGGAVLNETGDLDLSDSLITGNNTTSYGAGIYSGCDTHCGAASNGDGYQANLVLTNSTLSGNHTTGAGGGGMYLNYGYATITSSTISGNTARWGGGIGLFNLQYGAFIEKSTISGNSATDVGAGGGGVYAYYNPDDLTIANSTISGNDADYGGGIYDHNSSPTGGSHYNINVRSSIVAGNTGTTGPDLYSNGGTLDVDFDLIGNGAGATLNDTNPGSNIVGSDAKLGVLADNGGPTMTMLPLAGSPAIDKGTSFGETSDQRGLTRPIDLADYPNSTAASADGTDIGAVELQTSPGGGPTTTPPTTTPPTTTAPKKKCKKKHKRSASAAKKCKKKKK
jgi:hypothetical protein